jgi:hypothetical protein
LPFLPLFDGVLSVFSSRTLNSSPMARCGNLTFGGMGGKSGKIVAKTARRAARFGPVSTDSGTIWHVLGAVA